MNLGEGFVPTGDGCIRLIRPAGEGSIPAVLMIPGGTRAPLPELSAGPHGRVGPNHAYYFRISNHAGGKEMMYHSAAGSLLFVGGYPNPVPLPRDAEMQNTDAPIQTISWPRVIEALGILVGGTAEAPPAAEHAAERVPMHVAAGGISAPPQQEQATNAPPTDEPDDLEAVNSMSLPDAAVWYVRHRFVITACLPRLKRAYIDGWNKTHESAGWIDAPEKAAKHWQANPNDNIGMILDPSKVIVFDIDNVEITKKAFKAIGMEEVLSSSTAGIKSGRPNSGKLVFRAPTPLLHGLQHHTLKAKIGGDDTVVFELRAGMIQDVLPPSVHPETQKPYQWVGNEPIAIQYPPTTLMALWVNFEKYKPALIAAAEGREISTVAPPTQKTNTSGFTPRGGYDHTAKDVVEEWNRRHTLTTELTQYGYRPTSNPKKWDRPDCKESDGGVVILDPDKFYVHNASDEFCDGNPHDCFDLFRRYEHNGDWRAALSAAEKEMGMTTTRSAPDMKAVAEIGMSMSADRREKVERNRRMLLEETEHTETVQKSKVFEGYRISEDGVPEFHVKGHITLRWHMAEMAKFCLEMAVVPRPETAWIAAVMFSAAVCGRHFCFRERGDVYSLIYMCCFAESGTGKNDIKNCIRALASRVGCGYLVAGGDGWISDSGVHSSIVLNPQSVACWDEMGAMLKKMVGGNDRVAASAMTELTKQYTSAHTTFEAKKFAEHPNPNHKQGYELEEVAKYESVKRPCMSVVGMGVPSDMQVITEELIETGTMARWLFIEMGREPRHISESGNKPLLPSSTVDYIREILLVYGSEDPGDTMIHLAPHGKWTDPILMKLSHDSKKTWADYFNQQQDESYALDSVSERALKNRELEIASRLAIPMTILGAPECEEALKDIIGQKKRKQLRDSSLRLKTEEILKEMDIFSGDDVPEIIKTYKHNENLREKWENYRDYSAKKQAHDEWESERQLYCEYDENVKEYDAKNAKYNEYLRRMDEYNALIAAWNLKTEEEKAQEEPPEKPEEVLKPTGKPMPPARGKFKKPEPERPPEGIEIEMPEEPEPEPPTDEEKAELEAALEDFERKKRVIAEIKAMERLDNETGVTTKEKYKEIQIPASVITACIEESARNGAGVKALWATVSPYSERAIKQARKAAEYIYGKLREGALPYVLLAEVKLHLKEEGLQLSGKRFEGKTEYTQLQELLETEYGFYYRKEGNVQTGRGYFYDGTAPDAQAKVEEFDDAVRAGVRQAKK